MLMPPRHRSPPIVSPIARPKGGCGGKPSLKANIFEPLARYEISPAEMASHHARSRASQGLWDRLNPAEQEYVAEDAEEEHRACREERVAERVSSPHDEPGDWRDEPHQVVDEVS